MRLFLARHGETEWNRERRLQGHTQVGLNQKGREQAARLARALKDENLAAIYSSPLPRAMETAQAIAGFHRLQVEPAEELKELDLGELNGLTSEAFREKYPKFLQEWRANAYLPLPGGESLGQLQARAWAAIKGMSEKHHGEGVVAVAHNFTILTVICSALDLDLARFRVFHQALASLSIVEFHDNRVVLAKFNDTCHLGDLA